MCNKCEINWCYATSTPDESGTMLSCQVMTNQGICHACQYASFNKQSSNTANKVPNTLVIDKSQSKSSSTNKSSSPMPSPDSKKKPPSSNKRACTKNTTTKPKKRRKKKSVAQTAELKEPDSDNDQSLNALSEDEDLKEDHESTNFMELK